MIHFRYATADDAAALAVLRWLSRSADERCRESSEEFGRTFSEWWAPALASGRWHVAVGVAGEGRLAGCMYLNVVEKVPVPGEPQRAWGYLTHAFVVEVHRNKGIGASMLKNLVQHARGLKLELLTVWPSGEAVKFYERAGFLGPEAQREALPDDEPPFILPLRGRGGADF